MLTGALTESLLAAEGAAPRWEVSVRDVVAFEGNVTADSDVGDVEAIGGGDIDGGDIDGIAPVGRSCGGVGGREVEFEGVDLVATTRIMASASPPTTTNSRRKFNCSTSPVISSRVPPQAELYHCPDRFTTERFTTERFLRRGIPGSGSGRQAARYHGNTRPGRLKSCTLRHHGKRGLPALVCCRRDQLLIRQGNHATSLLPIPKRFRACQTIPKHSVATWLRHWPE